MYKIIKSNGENGSRFHNNKCVIDDSSARLLPLGAKTLTMEAEAEIRLLINTKRNKRSPAEAINDLKVRPNTNQQADPITSQNPPKKVGLRRKLEGEKSKLCCYVLFPCH